MADYMPLLKAIEKALAKADADLEAFLEEQGYPNPSGLVEAIDSVQDVLEELLDDYLERIATALIGCTDKFELMDAWNEAKEDTELKRTASDAVAEALFSYALPFLDEYIKNDDEELDASELSLKAIAEVLTLADQMTEGKIDSLNDRIEAGLQNYKEPEDSEADKAEKAAVEKGVLDDLKSKLRSLGSKIKSYGQRVIEYVFGSSKLDRARDCRGTATQTVLMYESVVQQEAIMQNPVVERKIWRHNPSEHPRENHVAMDGVMADADGFFKLTGRDGNVYHIEGPRASSLPPSESYNCHCTVETVINTETKNSGVDAKTVLQAAAVAAANSAFQSSADKETYERATEWSEKLSEEKLDNSEESGIMLPRYEDAVIPDAKLLKYALNPEKAPDKAAAFKAALGYDLSNYQDLIQNIMDHLGEYEAVPKGNKGYGETYEVIMNLTGPNGKTAKVLTAWIDDADNGEMRLTTVHVDK